MIRRECRYQPAFVSLWQVSLSFRVYVANQTGYLCQRACLSISTNEDYLSITGRGKRSLFLLLETVSSYH